MLPEGMVFKRNESELSIILTNKSRIELKGADNEDSLRGVGVSFVVLDEYGVMKGSEWHEVIRPMLLDTKGRALFIGTPKGQNAFYDIFVKGEKKEGGFSSHRFSSFDNPYIPREELEEARKNEPKVYFEQEYLASFVTDEEKVLITSKMLDDLSSVDVYINKGKKVISCDPSEGGDKCAIQVIEDYRVTQEKEMYERDTMKIVGELMVLSGTTGINDFIIDKIGTGKGIVDRLNELGKNVFAFNSSEKAINEDRFYNRKAEAWWELMLKLRDKMVPYPASANLRRQLNAVHYQVVDSNGKIQLEPKHKTKQLLGHSPDDADAYVMGMYALDHMELSSRKTHVDEYMTDKQGRGTPMISFEVDSMASSGYRVG